MDGFNEGVWKMFTSVGDYERAFNQLQHQYRALSSGWMLAEFAGVQFVLSHFGQLPVPDALMLLAIGLAGAVGITLLWSLDLRVYHQLLESCFVEGLKLERQHPWLPRLRHNMVISQGTQGQGVLARVAWFYAAGVLVSLAIAWSGAFVAAMGLGSHKAEAIAVLSAGGALAILAWLARIIKGARSPLLDDWLARHPGQDTAS